MSVQRTPINSALVWVIIRQITSYAEESVFIPWLRATRMKVSRHWSAGLYKDDYLESFLGLQYPLRL